MTRVDNAANVVLFGDVDSASVPDRLICWSPALDPSAGPTTLADVINETDKVLPSPRFDLDRHDGKANLAFADGHVATLPIKADALADAYLLPE